MAHIVFGCTWCLVARTHFRVSTALLHTTQFSFGLSVDSVAHYIKRHISFSLLFKRLNVCIRYYSVSQLVARNPKVGHGAVLIGL